MNAAFSTAPAAAAYTPRHACFDHDPGQWAHPGGRRGVRLRGAAVTHSGLIRRQNEDSMLLRPDAGVFGVADGLGGHKAGEVASAMALDVLDGQCDRRLPVAQIPRTLHRIVEDANAAIFRAASESSSLEGMGTTLSAIWFVDDRALVGHVGDSRIYRLRGGVLQQLTDDHTMLAEAIRDGVDHVRAKATIPASIVTRAVGIRPRVIPMLSSCSVRPGDRFLLCSDGLSDLADAVQLTDRLTDFSDPETAAEVLLDDALAAGGHDNITLVIIDAV
ncbi:MAG: serine/threonine protein phosphatase PrpC [Bradymonadia bacterium]|jgi:serine/threonine protein phosphatase PrpC